MSPPRRRREEPREPLPPERSRVGEGQDPELLCRRCTDVPLPAFAPDALASDSSSTRRQCVERVLPMPTTAVGPKGRRSGWSDRSHCGAVLAKPTPETTSSRRRLHWVSVGVSMAKPCWSFVSKKSIRRVGRRERRGDDDPGRAEAKLSRPEHVPDARAFGPSLRARVAPPVFSHSLGRVISNPDG
jgi:hypothetical protein